MARVARREVIAPHAPDTDDNIVIVAGCNTDALGGVRVPKSCRCIADQCSMWRWAGTKKTRRIEHRIHDGFSYIVHEPVPLERTHGYCGLAGRQDLV